MGNAITIEQLDATLSGAPVKVTLRESDNGEQFNRRRYFTALGNDTEYCIVWFTNLCYLEIPATGLTVPFNRISLDGCWPNAFRLNLNFIFDEVKTCILPVAAWTEETK